MRKLQRGQLYRWEFSFGQNGWWPVIVVSTLTRTTAHHGRTRDLQMGNLLMLVIVDDPGPVWLNEVERLDENGVLQPPTRWHVFMVECDLVWLKHDWLSECSLVAEAP